MTFIDYVPVGEEVRPNVLLSETKKVYYFKGHGMHYSPFFWINRSIGGQRYHHKHAGLY